jgi:hypothetical protein
MKPSVEGDNRRHRFLVDGEMQLRLISRLVIILAANLALFVALAIMMPAAVGYFGGSPQWGVFEAMRRGDVLATTLLLPLGCSFLCFFGQGFRETLKIAGPNYRFRSVFRDLAALRISRGVRIRKNDYLQSTANELHAGLERLHDEVATLRRLARYGAAADPDEAKRSLDELVKRLDAFTLLSCAPECRVVDERTASPATPATLATPAAPAVPAEAVAATADAGTLAG